MCIHSNSYNHVALQKSKNNHHKNKNCLHSFFVPIAIKTYRCFFTLFLLFYFVLYSIVSIGGRVANANSWYCMQAIVGSYFAMQYERQNCKTSHVILSTTATTDRNRYRYVPLYSAYTTAISMQNNEVNWRLAMCQ